MSLDPTVPSAAATGLGVGRRVALRVTVAAVPVQPARQAIVPAGEPDVALISAGRSRASASDSSPHDMVTENAVEAPDSPLNPQQAETKPQQPVCPVPALTGAAPG